MSDALRTLGDGAARLRQPRDGSAGIWPLPYSEQCYEGANGDGAARLRQPRDGSAGLWPLPYSEQCYEGANGGPKAALGAHARTTYTRAELAGVLNDADDGMEDAFAAPKASP